MNFDSSDLDIEIKGEECGNIYGNHVCYRPRARRERAMIAGMLRKLGGLGYRHIEGIGFYRLDTMLQ